MKSRCASSARAWRCAWIAKIATPFESLSSSDIEPYTKAPDETRAPMRSACDDTEVTMHVVLPQPSTTTSGYTAHTRASGAAGSAMQPAHAAAHAAAPSE